MPRASRESPSVLKTVTPARTRYLRKVKGDTDKSEVRSQIAEVRAEVILTHVLSSYLIFMPNLRDC